MLFLYSLPSFVFFGTTMIIGHIMKKYPAQYGSNVGYNTLTSRKSKEIWDYAQKISVPILLRVSCFSLIAFCASMLITVFKIEFFVKNEFLIILFNVTAVIIMIMVFFGLVEIKLRKARRGLK